MTTYLYTRFADEAAWVAARDAIVAAGTVFVADVLGTVWHQGATELDPPIAQPGWCVNLVVDGITEVPPAIAGALVNPVQPKRVFCGIGEIALPEALIDAGKTALVARPIGAAVDEARLARAEQVAITARLRAEASAARRAFLEANLAVIAARVEFQRLRDVRADAIVRMGVAGTARNEANTKRAVQLALRTQAIADIGTMTGAARVDAIARRDAATAEAARLAEIVTEQNAALVAATAERDAATAALATATADMAALRAARDALPVT